jgi:hypothetical protein
MSANVSMKEKDDLGATTGADTGGGDSFLVAMLGLALSLAAAALAAIEVPGFLEADTNVENTLVAGLEGATTVPLDFPTTVCGGPLATWSDGLALEAAASARLRSAA